MNRTSAVEKLNRLGFRGTDLYLAELIPAVEMAWADGVVAPNEIAILEAYCETLIEALNQQAGARLFELSRAHRCLRRLVARRLTPGERQLALEALRDWSSGVCGATQRKRMKEWAEAVAAVDGSPVWDSRELFWLQRLCTMMETH